LDVKKRYTEEQIIGFLKEADQGVAVKELCRKHGFSEPSYYEWRKLVRRHGCLGCQAPEGA
jgi:putative transposase